MMIGSSRAAYLHSVHEFAKFAGCIPLRGPTEEYGPGRLVDENLKDTIGRCVGGGHELLQAVVEADGVLCSRAERGGRRSRVSEDGLEMFITYGLEKHVKWKVKICGEDGLTSVVIAEVPHQLVQ
jgi:hypothetical protein